jgi:hypothetical protein
LELNCIMTNVMQKFLIYLSIYFCLTCFGLSFSPSSEAGVQLRQLVRSSGYGVSAWALKLLSERFSHLVRKYATFGTLLAHYTYSHLS